MERFSICGTFLGAAALVWLSGVNASAQTNADQRVEGLAILSCNQTVRFSPKVEGSPNLVSLPVTGNASVATGVGGRIGGGTAGQIEIQAHAPGNTLITYGLEDFSGKRIKVAVTVVVYCSDMLKKRRPTVMLQGPGPEREVPIPDIPYYRPPQVPTHRTAGCKPCEGIADQLNAAADRLAEAVQKILKDQDSLLDCYDPIRFPKREDLIAALNKAQAVVEADRKQIESLQAEIRELADKLNACEKQHCSVSQTDNPAPPPAPLAVGPGPAVKLGPAAKPGPGIAPPSKPPVIAVPAGAMESCLVGTWRSELAVIPGLQSGGAGIVLSIKADGTELVDYTGMQPLKDNRGNTNLWSGTALGHIAAQKGMATFTSVEKSALTLTYTPVRGAPRTNSMGGLGPAGLGYNTLDHSYTCDATTLTFKFLAFEFTFKRDGNRQ
jgi:hypothetical protein